MRYALRRVALSCVALCGIAASALSAQRVPTAYPRDSIAARLRELHRIATPEGIDTLVQLDVNDSRQWISIRGLNRANPVLFVLHGGPGSALLGSTWAYQKPWEDFFTVVNWDQRGVGKNFSPADSARLGATLSPEQLAQDAAVVVEHLRRLLGPRPIVVMGFSYGSSIGPRLVELRPDRFAAYVGVGQMANAESEDILYRETRRRAAAAGDSTALRALDSLAPYPPRDRKPNYRELNVVRRYSALFDGNWYGKTTLDLYYALPAWGPAYTREEAELVGPASGWMGRHLVDGSGGARPRIVERLAVPAVILAGRHDLMTPYDAARSYFERLEAPSKRFITFERSAHFVMMEEPGRFLLTLVRDVLPLAGGSPEFEPR